MALRQLLSVVMLPFVVVGVIPFGLLNSVPSGTPAPWQLAAGVLVFATGFTLFAWCVVLFARVGRGTLAPWDPTTALVAVGPYRYVRNPMISGVAAMLLGQALYFNSQTVGVWFLLVVLLNHFYFIYSEEPGLEQRFGQAYRDYKAAVPRWLPRVKR